MTDDDKARLSRQKTKRTVMGAFLGLLVLGGAAFFLTSTNAPDDTLVPQQVQQAPGAMDNDITDLTPATTPGSPPPIPLEDGTLSPNAADRDPPMLPPN